MMSKEKIEVIDVYKRQLLQWVNTIWVQDSGDTGQAGDTSAARHQQKIYYRDDVYYNLYMTNEIQ